MQVPEDRRLCRAIAKLCGRDEQLIWESADLRFDRGTAYMRFSEGLRLLLDRGLIIAQPELAEPFATAGDFELPLAISLNEWALVRGAMDDDTDKRAWALWQPPREAVYLTYAAVDLPERQGTLWYDGEPTPLEEFAFLAWLPIRQDLT